MTYFLKVVEDDSHGYLHFTVAGTGGDYAVDDNDILRYKFNMTNADFLTIDEMGHIFFKNEVTDSWSSSSMLNCSFPWDPITQTLSSSAEPGEDGGPTCNCDAYLDTEDDVDYLINGYFGSADTTQSILKESILDMSYDDKKEIMSLLCGRFLIEGDMASSGASQDPIFWVAHGAVEKVFQKIVFEDWLEDWDYPSVKSECSGHEYNGTKYWLNSFSFNDDTIDAAEITNAQFLEYLSPNSDFYKNNINFVYDHSDWSTVCEPYDVTLFD
jgi:hypothetical protein